jgi:predicted transcriptional regulator
MFGEEYFFGKEVEGPLADVETCFVRTRVPEEYEKYPHVYFCISYVEKNYWNIVEDCLLHGQIVTLEVTPELLKTIPPTIFNKCKIMLSLECPELELLKKNDILKIVTKPFTTYNVVKCSMQQSIPDDYKFDSKKSTL